MAETGLGGFKTKSEREADFETAKKRHYADKNDEHKEEEYVKAYEALKAARPGPALHACAELADALEATILHEEETQPEIAQDPSEALKMGLVWGPSTCKRNSSCSRNGSRSSSRKGSRSRSASRQGAGSSVVPADSALPQTSTTPSEKTTSGAH